MNIALDKKSKATIPKLARCGGSTIREGIVTARVTEWAASAHRPSGLIGKQKAPFFPFLAPGGGEDNSAVEPAMQTTVL
jgi:hypothetical protein